MFGRAGLLLGVFLAALAASAPTGAEAKITYIKPLWQPVSEWSPPEDREESAELHSAAMKLYSEYVESTGVQPCTAEDPRGGEKAEAERGGDRPMSPRGFLSSCALGSVRRNGRCLSPRGDVTAFPVRVK